MKISFLASHGGSSARAIITKIKAHKMAADIGILITNNRNSNIFNWCLDNNIEVRHISAKTHRGEASADEAIQTVLQNAGSDLVVCSGYMKKLGPITLESFSGKLLNIHPALLPKYGGQGMYGDIVHRAVLKAQEHISGATVHYVTANYDEGTIIKQQSVVLAPGETLETLRAKVQAIEPGLYIDAINFILAAQ